jgi:hypothetical protein
MEPAVSEQSVPGNLLAGVLHVPVAKELVLVGEADSRNVMMPKSAIPAALEQHGSVANAPSRIGASLRSLNEINRVILQRSVNDVMHGDPPGLGLYSVPYGAGDDSVTAMVVPDAFFVAVQRTVADGAPVQSNDLSRAFADMVGAATRDVLGAEAVRPQGFAPEPCM